MRWLTLDAAKEFVFAVLLLLLLVVGCAGLCPTASLLQEGEGGAHLALCRLYTPTARMVHACRPTLQGQTERTQTITAGRCACVLSSGSSVVKGSGFEGQSLACALA